MNVADYRRMSEPADEPPRTEPEPERYYLIGAGLLALIGLLLAWAIVATVFAAQNSSNGNAGPALHCKPRPADRAYAFRGDRLDTLAGEVVTSVSDYALPSGRTCVVAATQAGRIYWLCPGDTAFTVWADLSPLMGTYADETGLLGIAIDGRNRFLYADFTRNATATGSGVRGNLCNRTTFEPPSATYWQTLPIVSIATVSRFAIAADGTDAVDLDSQFELLLTNRRSAQHQGYDTLRLTKRGSRTLLVIAHGEDAGRNPLGTLRKVDATTMYGNVLMMDVAAVVADGPMVAGIDLYAQLSPARQAAIEKIMHGLRNVGGMSIHRNLLGDRTTMAFINQGNEGGDGAYMVHYPSDDAPLPLDAGWPDIMGGMITTERQFLVAQQCPGFVSNATTYYPGASRMYVTVRTDKLFSKHDIIYRPYQYNGEDIAINANYADPMVGFCGPMLSSAFTYGGGEHNECPAIINTCQTLAGDYLGVGFTNVDLSLLATQGIAARIPKFIVATPNYRNTQLWTRQNLVNIHDVVLPYIDNSTIMSTTATQANADQTGFYFATFRSDGGYAEIYYAELVAA